MGTSTSDGGHLIGPLIKSTMEANEEQPAPETSAAQPAKGGAKRKARSTPAPGRKRTTPKKPARKASGPTAKKASPKRPAPGRKAAKGPAKRAKAGRGRPRAR